MHIIILGPPGAGKGTQASLIASRYKIAHISTGDMLRTAVASGSELGNKVKSVMDSGTLVSDEIMIDLIKARVAEKDCAQGYLLDGFPRTVPQADALTQNDIYINHIIEIDVADEEIVQRMAGRRVHPASGRTYHVKFNPPKLEGKDDITGERLVQREDDKEETVRKRLGIYREQTQPLVHYYQKWSQQDDTSAPQYHKIDGIGSVEIIQGKIHQALAT